MAQLQLHPQSSLINIVNANDAVSLSAVYILDPSGRFIEMAEKRAPTADLADAVCGAVQRGRTIGEGAAGARARAVLGPQSQVPRAS